MKASPQFLFLSSIVICILKVSLTISTKESFSIERMDKLEGLRLKEMGNLKLIVEFRVLTFQFNMSAEAEDFEIASNEQLKQIKNLYVSQVNSSSFVFDFKSSIDELEGKIKTIKENIQKMTNGKVQSFRQRSKRFFSFMTNIEEGSEISEDLRNLFKTVENLRIASIDNRERIINISRNVADAFNEQASQTMLHQNQTIALKLDVMILKLQKNISQYEDRINKIHSMMVHKKLESSLVSVHDMHKQLEIIVKNFTGTGKEPPFSHMNEYFSKISVTHKIKDGIFEFFIKIPIVENELRTLFQIEKVPTRVDNKLIVLDTHWSYLANTSDQIVKFANLHQCFKTENTHLCEIQSTIHSTNNSKDCLTKSFTEKKIDLETCESFVRGVQFTNLTFIKQSEGRFFYFTQQNESLQIFCKGKESFVTLEPEMGMVKLSTGCVAKTNHERLLVTDEVAQEPVRKVVNVRFDRKQFESHDNLNFQGLSVSYLYKSVDELERIASSPGQFPDIVIAERNYKNDIIYWVNILVLPGLALIIFLLYLLCRRPKYAVIANVK